MSRKIECTLKVFPKQSDSNTCLRNTMNKPHACNTYTTKVTLFFKVCRMKQAFDLPLNICKKAYCYIKVKFY